LNFIQDKFIQGITIIFGEIDFSVFSTTQIIIDILLFTTIIYVILRFIVRIHAFQIVITIFIFALLLFFSQSLNLVASQIILKGIFILLLIAIPIMFQQEIRQLFEKLGSSPLLVFQKSKITKRHYLIKTIKQTSGILAEKKHGALIVIEQRSPLYVYSETGLMLNAQISKELLLNIFFPKSPLHDGAVIIRNNIIISAGAVLPFTHTPTEFLYGTRHKSALGLSEITDAVIVVISEERGEISVAHNGEMQSNISIEELEKVLLKIK
jgi:diadenylate cyclase